MKMLPCVLGGPGTNITFGPYDHRFVFEAYHRPGFTIDDPAISDRAGG